MKDDPKIIVALDFDTLEQVQELVTHLDPTLCRLKVGNILFTRFGPMLVEQLMQAGFDVFLDLKFHDIPQTVARACQSAAELGVWMVNVHISGGRAMLQAAREKIDSCSHKPLLIGVSVLTSLEKEDLALLSVSESVEALVTKMALEASACHLDGIVCSSQEVASLRAKLGNDFLLVTPGIRLQQNSEDDQKRIMTPSQAIAAGASYLVVGRPITQASDPVATLAEINQSVRDVSQ